MKLTKSPVMLACNTAWSLSDLRFSETGYLISNKIDGVRAWGKTDSNGLVSLATRTPHKYIENRHTQSKFSHTSLANLDGELVIPGCDFHTTSGILRSKHDARGADSVWCLFDRLDNRVYYARRPITSLHKDVRVLAQVAYEINGSFRTDTLATELVELGIPFEGYIIRAGYGYYKFGRATRKEATLFKLVEWAYGEAIVWLFEPRISNESTIPLDMVGSITCYDSSNRVICFNVGSGFSHQQAKEWWKNRSSLTSSVITYKYKLSGIKYAPRQPIYVSGLP